MEERYIAEFAQYLVPGKKSARKYIPGENGLLFQSVEGGFIFHEFHGNNLVREKIIDAISLERAEQLTLLGEAEGESLPECFSVVSKNVPGFLDAVIAYRGEPQRLPPTKLRIYFYAG